MWPNLTKNTAKFYLTQCDQFWPKKRRKIHIWPTVENFEPKKSHEIQILTSVAKFDPKNAAKLNFTQCDLIIYEKYGQAKMLGSPGTPSK